MLFGPRHFFSAESYDQDEDEKEKEEDDDDRGEKQRSLSTVTFDGSLLLPPLVDCSSNASPCPFFVLHPTTYWRANSSNEITACKRLFTRRVLKEIVKNYIILPLRALPPLLLASS